MAKKIRVAGKATIKDLELVKGLTWVLKEIKKELGDMCDESVRLLAIKHEVRRLLKKYDIVR